MIVLGADVLRMSVWDAVDPLPEDLPIIQIGLNDWEMGKNYAAEMAIGSDVRETLKALSPVLKERGGSQLADVATKRMAALASKNWSANRASLIKKIESESSGEPINPDWLMLQISEALPDNGIIVNEGVTASRYLNDIHPYPNATTSRSCQRRDRMGYRRRCWCPTGPSGPSRLCDHRRR